MAVSTRFVAATLRALPPLPDTLEDAVILDERLTQAAGLLNAAGIPYDVAGIKDAPGVKADTVAIIQRVGAYREWLCRGAYTDAQRSVLVAFSWGPYLDHLGATQTPGVVRKPLVASPRTYVYGTDSVADWEQDDDFRERIMLAPETLSAAGPEGAYYAFAIDVPGVSAAAAYGPMSFGGTIETPFTPLGCVRVPIVAEAGDGTAQPALVAAVQAELRPDDRRPLADFVTASASVIEPYAIEVVLYLASGVVEGPVVAAAEAQLADFARQERRPGGAAKLLSIAAAASVTAGGVRVVRDLDILSPLADVNAGRISPANPGPAYRAPHCTGITVRAEVRYD